MTLNLQEALHWRGIEMLPVMDEVVINEIQEAYEQLALLSAGYVTDEAMTNDQLQRIITDYELKSAIAHSLKSQCYLWQHTLYTPYLSDAQKDLLTSLGSNLVMMEKVSQRILQHIQQQYAVSTPKENRCQKNY